jgi:hypothetical protein
MRRHAYGNAMSWKRTLFLAPLVIVFAVLAKPDDPVIGKTSGRVVLAALKDPLALFAARSPGTRGAGALHSTKPGPARHERVLAMVREREPSPGIPADPGSPVFGDAPAIFAAIPDAAPQDRPRPEDPPAARPYEAPFPIPPYQPGLLIYPGGAPAVPEPGTWVMLIAGFFAAGAAMRRRPRKQSSLTESKS